MASRLRAPAEADGEWDEMAERAVDKFVKLIVREMRHGFLCSASDYEMATVL